MDRPLPLDTTPERVASRLARGEDLSLLDVRTPHEWAICRLDGALHVPMDRIVERLPELDPAREIVVYCHHGPRSAMVVRFLRDRGFHRAVNLAGGIDAWARTVDPGLPRY